ncbi:galectin-3-binding protein-like [Ptychodera flava]|uniref:galectin-3-binding protein-like n=1 Tax=Ptychodera flava TaxID=63121 RepID=UPI003969DD8B
MNVCQYSTFRAKYSRLDEQNIRHYLRKTAFKLQKNCPVQQRSSNRSRCILPTMAYSVKLQVPKHCNEDYPNVEMRTSDHSEIAGSCESYVSSLSSLFNQPDLSDVILKVGDMSYYAHRFLLAHFSEVMRTMLTESRWRDSQQAKVKLQETPECATVFEDFLKFMYSGRIELKISRALPVLVLADKYNVTLLKPVCEDYMARQVTQSRNVQGALQWWEHAKTYNLKHLELECLELIQESLNAAIKTPEWLNLSIDQLCTILESSDVVVQDEYTLYKGVESWLQSANHKAKISKYLDRVLPLLRFTQMTPQQIDAIEKSQMCKKFSNKFNSYVLQAYKFFAMGRNMAPDNSNAGYQLREYGQSPLQETEISVYNTNLQESFPGYQHTVAMHHKSIVGGVPVSKSRQRGPNLDICGKPNKSGASYGLYLRFLPEGHNIYSIRIRLIDGQSRKTLSVIRGNGKVGEKTPHVAYVDIENHSYHKNITEMFTAPARQQYRHGYNYREYQHTMPILCAFLGIKNQPAHINFAIRVTFYE